MPDFQRVSWHRQWLALNDQYARQLDIWAVTLARLERQRGWFAMSDADRDRAERASGLTDTNTRLRLMDRRLRRWLRFLPKTPAIDIEGVVANLQVAERLLAPEENRIVHGLIVRAARDLSRLKPGS
ncbi:hypothetical protein NI456_11210 [Brevundimonas diminuta]|uniref:hypothetical protein n=1 Tax=Brevundimonas diminuta TaxID=293 RepID=UPI0020975292|nr:hypothetical protein [Brevundimonas diminuta]MCO8019425.1 hypothetical protein [Brevundimonas diminuta]MCO8022103.1 hypothetical protein [Brevundimonas diminuta]